jgi:hypothetical protein
MTGSVFAKLCSEVNMLQGNHQSEVLFEFRIGHRIVVCELCCHGQWGVEARFVESDGQVRLRQRFLTRALAVDWAEEEQRAMARDAALASEESAV